MEKHGLHLPLGNDLINVRYASLHAAEQEYTLVFPEYYFSQIFEARHQPGTVAYSARLQLDLLQETTDEMGRNGCKKIIIVNGHGGNEHLLPFFAQSQLASPHDYIVYVFNRPSHSESELAGRPPMKSSSYATDFHAGEGETSRTMVARPDLVHLDRAKTSRVRTRPGKSCRTACTPESGGMRVFRTTTPAMVRWPARNWVSSTPRWRSPTWSPPFAP